MARDTKKALSQSCNTKSRREALDYDYLDKLSPEELAYLAQFSEEFYGASFEKNPAYAKKSEYLQLIMSEISKTTDQKKLDKLNTILQKAKTNRSNYVQVSENKIKKENFDLRKCRSIDLYYKDSNNRYSKSKKHKYTENNIHNMEDGKHLKDCNDRSIHAQNDMMNKGMKTQDLSETLHERTRTFESPEDMMLKEDNIDYYTQISESMDLDVEITEDDVEAYLRRTKQD